MGALVALLLIVFIMGGASRTDVQSLVIIRPVSILFLAYGLFNLRMSHIRRAPLSAAIIALAVLLVVLHLVPLPPSIWMSLPGRGIIADIDRISGVGPVWRPLSMVPDMTRNALFSLAVPVAVLLMALQVDERERTALLPLFILFGLASGLLGAMQSAGEPGGALYLYAQTTTGTANGLFANRNHNGVLLACLFPMLTAYSVMRTRERNGARWAWIAGALSVVVLALVLVVGSRAGLLCAVMAIVLSPLLVRDRLRRTSRRVRRIAALAYAAGCAGFVALIGLFALFSRAESLQRLLASDAEGDRRLQVWGPVWEMTRAYFPVGSGIGSYIKVFQLNEPRDILTLNYSNHAHNDWLEVAMTAGLPGVLLLAATLIGIALLSWRAWKSGGGGDPLLARTASIILLLLGLASIGDYPMRTPSMMAFFVVALVWLEVRPVVPSAGSSGEVSAPGD
jgi:O-antigen ligase